MARPTREQVGDALRWVGTLEPGYDADPMIGVLHAEVIALRLELERLPDDDMRKRLRITQAAVDNAEAEVRKLREELRQWQEGELCLREPDCTCHQEEGDDECAVHDARATIARVEALKPKWRDQANKSHGSSFADGCAFAMAACADDLRDALRGPE